ncbi:MAG: hypothetical protein J5365_06640 [Erysipelotrichaceae bacterium]|nr:hypothetical protein [Erysipelotrichaceae bacterium]
MKRLILMVLVLMLWGCSESSAGDGARNELVKDYGFKMEEDLKAYIGDHFDVNENYAMGNGIKILNLDKSSEELQMFPVYRDEDLIFTVLYGQETLYLSEPAFLAAIEENSEFLILKADGNIYYVSKEEILSADGEGKELSDKMKSRIEKIRDGQIDRNLMGIEKRTIRLVSQQDDQPVINEADYRNDRIIVRFVSDDIENKIRMYEAFCHGKVQDEYFGDNTYLFCFEPLNSKNLKILLDASNGLSYVLNASLDERIDNVEPVDGLETE